MSRPNSRPILLLVEDSEDDLFFFQRTLKATGVDCTLVHIADGAEAIRYLEACLAAPDDATHPWPDIVFLDLKLPTFSGFEILRWIRDHNLDPMLDIAILSGSEDSTDVERALALGAADYLVKPMRPEKLRSRLLRWTESTGGRRTVASRNFPAER